MMLVPPTNSVNGMLRVKAEVAIKFITKFCGLKCSKGSHIVKNVITF
jgi:hypothetical protein